MASLIGSKVERKEDKRFLTGKGQYTADINLVNQTYAIFVRSPHARAKITKIDLLQKNNNPSEHEIRDWLEGNICRCTGYQGIVAAVKDAASKI